MKHSKAFRQNCLDLTTTLQKVKQVYGHMYDYIGTLEPEEFRPASDSSLRHFLQLAFFYIAIIEITGNYLADSVILHLIETGHDFHIERAHKTPRIKHVVYLKDLEEERVSLTTKLNFIEDCGITVFKSMIDTKLRNDIAHMNFEIKENTVYIRGKPAVPMIYNSLRKGRVGLDAHDSLMRKATTDLETRMDSLKKALSDRKSKR